jgi:hypothetical protein
MYGGSALSVFCWGSVEVIVLTADEYRHCKTSFCYFPMVATEEADTLYLFSEYSAASSAVNFIFRKIGKIRPWC